MSTLEIGIAGAGAVTEICHLPAARVCPGIRVVALADKTLERVRVLAERFDVPLATTDYREFFGRVQGIVIALPHHLHAPVTIEFLRRGIPVLVEKPLALTVAEGMAMVAAARDAGVLLQVGHHMRFYQGARILKQAVTEDWLGALKSFWLEWGFVYDWPVTSAFFFQKDQAGGGVLRDTGSHMLDLLLWWLGTDAEVVDYADDSVGGVEAECELSLVIRSATGPIRGTVVLSRLRKLHDIARIVGERFTVEHDFSAPCAPRLWPSAEQGRRSSFVNDYDGIEGKSPNPFVLQLRDFARSIREGTEPFVSGDSALVSLALIERCYAARRVLEQPWMRRGKLRGPSQPVRA